MAVNVPKGFPLKTGHIFIIIALIMAVVSALLIKNMASGGKEQSKAKSETEIIAVAAVAVPEGATLTAEDFKLVEWPVAFLPTNSVFNKADSVSLIGRTTRTSLMPGEVLYKEKLSGDKSMGGMPVLIPKGMRAVTLGVTEIKGVAGFIKPGDKVDVLATFEETGEADQKVRITKTVLQNVLVMASAQQMVRDYQMNTDELEGLKDEATDPEKEKKKKKKKEKSESEIKKEKKERAKERKEMEKSAKTVSSITLALNPEQAEKVALAEEIGEIRLVLRPEGDAEMAGLVGITNEELLTEGSLPDGKRWPFKFANKIEPVIERPEPHQPSAPPMPGLALPSGPPMKPGKSIEFIEGSEKTTVEL